MCLGGLSKDYDKNSCKNTRLYGNVYDFSVDYSAISNDKMHNTHSYLMVYYIIKMVYYKCLDLLKSVFSQQWHSLILICQM